MPKRRLAPVTTATLPCSSLSLFTCSDTYISLYSVKLRKDSSNDESVFAYLQECSVRLLPEVAVPGRQTASARLKHALEGRNHCGGDVYFMILLD